MASAHAKLDMKRVKNALFRKGENTNRSTSTIATMIEDATQEKESVAITASRKGNSIPSKWTIAFSAGTFFAISSFVLIQSFFVSGVAFVLAVYTASRDPITEVGIVEGDDISGPMTRIVGRATYQSIESAKPTLQAVTRVVVDGDVVVETLEAQVRELKEENEQLKLWVQRRNAVDNQMGGYTVGELKKIAKNNGLAVGGTKAQLMMRLVEAGSLELDDE